MASKETNLGQERLLDHYRDAIRTGKSPFPYCDTVGFRLIEVEPGRAVVELECGERHRNTIGTVHGGVHCSVADTAMGIAHASLLGADDIGTTVDLQIHFLRSSRSGMMRAEAKVVKAGRTLTLVECDVRDDAGKLLARASSKCMTIPGGQGDDGKPGGAA